jgi:hypothetical protein
MILKKSLTQKVLQNDFRKKFATKNLRKQKFKFEVKLACFTCSS